MLTINVGVPTLMNCMSMYFSEVCLIKIDVCNCDNKRKNRPADRDL
jgi:hypothetical protein